MLQKLFLVLGWYSWRSEGGTVGGWVYEITHRRRYLRNYILPHPFRSKT